MDDLFGGVNPRVILHNFFRACKRLIWFVLAATIAYGVYSYRQADAAYCPYYSSSAVFSVRASYYATTDITSYSSHINATAAEMLSATFPYVVRSENTQMLLMQELGRNSIPASINATSTADAALFTLTTTSTDPQAAYDVLCATITIYPKAASTILGDTQINTINMPTGPSTKPINANNAKDAAISAATPVFALGVVLIFLLSLTRKTVHSAEDLRKLANLKCLSYVPEVKLKKRSNVSNLNITITNPRTGSVFSESIRNLRLKVQKAMQQRHAKVLMISSTVPNEGKTTVATNLALSLAAEGNRVILIDGDLRKQSLKAALGVTKPSSGLVEILSGSTKDFSLLNVPNSTLLLLSGDKTTGKPQPLLDTPRMKQVIELLRDRLDYIIIDTPPAGMLSDAATISKYADATLYIVRQDLASTTQVRNSLQTLTAVDAPILGCVLNQTQAGTTRYGYGSKYSGGYGYSYGYKYSDSYHYYGRSHYSKSEDASANAPVRPTKRTDGPKFSAESLSKELHRTVAAKKDSSKS